MIQRDSEGFLIPLPKRPRVELSSSSSSSTGVTPDTSAASTSSTITSQSHHQTFRVRPIDTPLVQSGVGEGGATQNAFAAREAVERKRLRTSGSAEGEAVNLTVNVDMPITSKVPPMSVQSFQTSERSRSVSVSGRVDRRWDNPKTSIGKQGIEEWEKAEAEEEENASFDRSYYLRDEDNATHEKEMHARKQERTKRGKGENRKKTRRWPTV